MAGEGCILYLLPSDQLWCDPKLSVAQQHALKLKTPLAAVTCVLPDTYGEKLPSLRILEATLDRYQIPLIVLIGTEAATLPSLVKHTKPVHVYGHGGEPAGKSVDLKPHPYKWPGIVIRIDELKKIVDKEAYMC